LQVDNRTTCAPYPYWFSEQLRGGFSLLTYRLLAENGGIPVKASLSRNEVTMLLDELNRESMALSEEGR